MESALLGAGGKDKGSPATGSNGCGGEGIFHAHMPPHGGGWSQPACACALRIALPLS